MTATTARYRLAGEGTAAGLASAGSRSSPQGLLGSLAPEHLTFMVATHPTV